VFTRDAAWKTLPLQVLTDRDVGSA